MKNRQKMSLQNSDRVVVTFREVAVHFSDAEWERLNVGQKELYKDAMKNVHKALIALGYEIINSQVFIRLRKEEKEYVDDQQDTGHGSSCRNPSTSFPDIAPDVILVVKKEEDSCGEEMSKIESAAPLNTSVSSLMMKEEEDSCFREQDMDWRRIKQEQTVTWGCLALAREENIQTNASPNNFGVDLGRSTQAVSTLRDPDTARGGGGTLKEQDPGIPCDNYEAGGMKKTVSGVNSPTFKQHMPLREEKSIGGQTVLKNKCRESFDPRNVEEEIVLDIMNHQNKRKLNNDGERESSIMHERKPSKELKVEEQESRAPPGLSTQVTGTARHQNLRVNPNMDPSNLFASSLSGHNLWKRTLEEISSGNSEWKRPLEVAVGGSNRNDIHQNLWISATDDAAGCSRSVLQHKNWSNSLDDVANCSGDQAVLWQNEQTGKLEEASEGTHETEVSNDVWRYTSDEGAIDSSEIVCSQITWGAGKDISSRKAIPHSVEILPEHDTGFPMIQPDAGIKDFLSDLREDQRQTIRSFMKMLLNVIDQESVISHSVTPLLPPQTHSIPLQSIPVLPIETTSVQIQSDKNKSTHLHSNQRSAQHQSTQLRTAQSQPSTSLSFQSRVVQQPLPQSQHIQLCSSQLQSIQSQPAQPQSIPLRSAPQQLVHPRPVQSHSLHTQSAPLSSNQSRPVQPHTTQPRAVPPHSIQLQSVQPHTGQSWSAQPRSMDAQSPSAQALPPQRFLPRPIQSPTHCKTHLLQGSPTPEKIPLVVDPIVPERFSSVTVDKQHLRRLLMAAEGRVKKQAAFLLNGLIKLLFKKEELACSDGLGLRGKKSNSLDQVKVDAMREFLHSKCVERKWNHLDGNRFTRIITNKISNARRDLKQGNKGLKGLLDTKGQPQLNTRSETNMPCPLSSAVLPLPPLQTLNNNRQGERTLIKEECVQTDSDEDDCILTS